MTKRPPTFVPKRGHIPEVVAAEVLADLAAGKTYRTIADDYAVSIGWVSKLKHGKIRNSTATN